MTEVSVQKLLEECQTGDLLLYNSHSLLGRVIEYCSFSRYSHVAIILRDPIYIDPSLIGLYVLESGAENVPDSLTGKYIFGVQITPLENNFNYIKKNSYGNVYYRKLNCDRNDTFIENLTKTIKNTEGKHYDIHLYDWIRAKFDIEIGDQQITSRFWCSAFAGYVYVQLGLLDKDLGWSLLAPKRFSSYENMCLSFKNCTVDPEKYIKL